MKVTVCCSFVLYPYDCLTSRFPIQPMINSYYLLIALYFYELDLKFFLTAGLFLFRIMVPYMCIECALFNHINTIVQSVNLAIQKKNNNNNKRARLRGKTYIFKRKGW